MTHKKHKNVIDNYENIYPMISLIDESKTIYVSKRLPLHLHASQIKLLKEAKKHSKPHHKRVRIKQYQKLLNNPDQLDELFEIHKKLFIKSYQKLENKNLIKIDTDCKNLPYDVILTEKGEEILKQINELENEWEEIVLNGVKDKEGLLELLKQVANNALTINYKHKKERKFVF